MKPVKPPSIKPLRAYKFFEERSYEHGHDPDDWLQAEAEIAGKKQVIL